ncbi:Flp/Fap pilin component [Nitrobacter winogradskyi Nb-255]|uniref:Flp/Fap pilin component n=1 Tax=Nitrobacter winogradskyi (strain ATCC 25391 / DSM 10237 / CIP 104748 / NCIMB 11846 / Nb-255) TaxID=323098 RepID=Q3STH6_NITWN|nr:Flp family type IVb pilin [Nitrobacter winogradskyi]ABA04415.1 Flp/Fap pilin component [Nitrobacter winogradskyi Nb-255]
MRRLAKFASELLWDTSGATAIEYALIASGISIVIVAAVSGIGGSLRDRFDALNGLLK